MTERDSKIITTFSQRRAIEQAIKALGETTTEEELDQRVAEIANLGEGVLPALINQLDTSNAQIRGGLGRLAQRLPREQIAAALRRAAGDRTRPERARLTAIMILERFLNEPVGPDLLKGLPSADQLAITALEEALADIGEDPEVLMEYVAQLESEPLEVIEMTARATAHVQAPGVVELLRLLATHPQPSVARIALQQLGMIRSGEAAAALQSLLPNVSEALRPLAERNLRKLSLSGVSVTPPRVTARRVLISPIDSEGGQTLLFLCPLAEGWDVLLINILTHDQEGLLDVFVAAVPAFQLPAPRSLGYTHTIHASRAPGMLFYQEASLEAGLALLAEAVRVHLRHSKALPLVYRCYSRHLWTEPWGQGKSEDERAEADDGSWEPGDAVRLLDHPAFQQWRIDPLRLEGRWGDPESNEGEKIRRWARIIFDAQTLSGLERRLQRMGLWLEAAGEGETARLARWTAAHLRTVPPEEHPFLLRLIELGLSWRRPATGE